jgi:undecaprenyl phosphate N,N'-diacetylbacillosamine 1-phosphate transferase
VYKKYLKRLLDILLSLILIPLALIIIVIFGIIIRLEDGGSVFYCSKRLGKYGRFFFMYKLRTMKVNAPDVRTEDGNTWNSDSDPRVTRIGKFLRKTSLDEVPQVLNVLKGEMSFIGPRPDTSDFLEKYTEEERIILSVLPGITGYNQAYFRNSVDAKTKIKNDEYYAGNISFTYDLRIFLKTFISVIKHENIYTTQQIHNDKKRKT